METNPSYDGGKELHAVESSESLRRSDATINARYLLFFLILTATVAERWTDAFAACSLFISRTETNSRFVLRHITDHANELIGNPIPSLPAELIARAHATLLYQVMLICSNDVSFHYDDNNHPFLSLEILVHSLV